MTLSSFLPVVSPTQSICLFHFTSQDIFQFEIKPREIESLSSLSAIEVLACHKVFQVFVICPYFKFYPCSLQEMSPCLQTMYHPQYLLIMNFVVAFCFVQYYSNHSPELAHKHTLSQNKQKEHVRVPAGLFFTYIQIYLFTDICTYTCLSHQQ